MSHGIDYVPPKPLISRFVAPWDTSGWYYPAVDFAVGCKLYSNSDAVVLDAPKALWGGDYIVTFDSFTEGFDDKQGVTFTVEREARVYVALEQSAKGDFLSGFADAGEVLLASDRRVYRLLYRAYAQGEEVCLPGFEGACPHYTVIVCPLTADVPGRISCPVYAKSVSQTHRSLPAAWQVHEVFCGMPLGDAPKDFTCQGDCRVAQWKREPGHRCVRLYAGASLQKSVKTGGSDIAELSVSVLSGKATVSWCGAFITLERGHALLNGALAVGQELGDRFRIRFVRHDGQCEVWLNCRVAGVLPCQKGQTGLFTMLASQEGEAELELLSVRDQTSLPVWNERFTAPEKDWLFAPQTVIVRESLPFAAGMGLRIQGRGTASAVCPFPAMQGPVRIETTVKPTTKDFFILADVRDAGGAVALRVAMYCGNLYASNANQWERLTGGHISGLYYPCDNWFHLTLLIDLSRQRYDLVIDGAKRARDFHLACDARAIAQIGYQCPGAALSVGSLQIYDRLCSSDGMLPPTRVYDVTQAPYGARGDGKTLDTEAIQRALDDAAGTGGTVRLPRGVFLSGELFLRSDLTLWIDRGATLLGTQDHSQYPLMTPCDSLCAHRQLGRGLIYGEGVHNVRVTGGGTIDGNGRYRFKMNDPISDRERDARPDQIYIACSDGVMIEDLDIVNSAFWSVVPLSCRNVLIERLRVDAMNTPNRDGIDPVDCVDMTIRDCCIIAGDDGLCLKSSDDFGCRNIDLSGLVVQSLASGIKFGTDSYHSLVNVTIRDCILKNINRCGVSLESVDGATISGVDLRRLDMTDVGAPVYVALGVRGRRPKGEHPARTGEIRRVHFEKVSYQKPYPYSHAQALHEVLIVGESDAPRIEEITFEHCRFCLPGGGKTAYGAPSTLGKDYPEYDRHGASAGHAFAVRHVKNIRFVDCRAELEQMDIRPFVAAFDSEDVCVETIARQSFSGKEPSQNAGRNLL